MNALIVEDDPWIAELLRLILTDLDANLQIEHLSSAVAAQNYLRGNTIDLLIADLNLPDGNGLEVVRTAARRAPNSLRLLTTTDISRQLVLDARAAGITDFFAKPFKIDALRGRLAQLLQCDPANVSASANLGDLPSFLRARLEQPLRLAWSSPSQQQLAASSAKELNFERFNALAEAEPMLTLIALNRANRQLERGRATCLSLQAVWERLGPADCRELVARLAQARIALEHPLLQQRVTEFASQQQALSDALGRHSAEQAIPVGPLRAAISCSRLGELAVISAVQHFLNYGQQIDESSLDALINQHAAAFGNCIKTQQQLPFLLRELTGSLFQLPRTGLRKDRILLRIAALETGFTPADPDQLRQLRRLIGLPA